MFIQKDYKLLPSEERKNNENPTERNGPSPNEGLRLLSWLQINRPLVPLKICLFSFFAGGGAVSPFLQLNLVQLGITVEQLSIMYMFSPVVNFLGPAVSGILADKIGRAKPVFVGNMILAVISLNGMLLIPSLPKDCRQSSVSFDCPFRTTLIVESFSSFRVPGYYRVHKCRFHDLDDSRSERRRLPDITNYVNISTMKVLAITENQNSSCVYEANAILPVNVTWCTEVTAKNSNLLCYIDAEENCVEKRSSFALVFGLSFVLLMIFTTVQSNCYRMLDVTAMHMVKDHGSDFGKLRFWPILSNAILPPLAGLLVDKFSANKKEKDYSLAFHLYNFTMMITVMAIWKLDVRVSPPGKKMWKKTLLLLKEPDFLAFELALLFMGTCWGLSKNFANVYLQSIGADSLLLGLVAATSSLAGLPFLLTSNWWVKKIGTTKILLLGFVGYTTYFSGLYNLKNPWYAIPNELTTILTYHLLWVAVVRHSHSAAPESLTATVIASAGGIHYGLGKGSGALIGGFVRRDDGKNRVDPLAFLVAAVISAMSFILYSTFLLCRQRFDRSESAVKTHRRC